MAALLLRTAPPTLQVPLKKVPSRLMASGLSASRAAAASERGVGSALRFDAVLVDVGGCLLQTKDSITDTYQRIAGDHGVEASKEQIKMGFKAGFSGENFEGGLRYVGDGRVFWRRLVADCLGSDDDELFEALYGHYASGGAWKLAEGAETGLRRLRDSGVLLAVCSNFDTRLRPLLEDLNATDLFDGVVVSAEVGAEKPDPRIFRHAMGLIGVEDPSRVLMVGDDEVNDVGGAQGVGMESLLWGEAVSSFEQVADHVLSEA